MDDGARLIHVIHAEDDPFVADAVKIALEQQGFRVTTVHTVGGALRCVAPAPDAFVVDLQLPDGDGLKLCRALRDECPTTAIVILSGQYVHADLQDTRTKTAVAVGADDFVTKPFNPERLAAAIRGAMRVRHGVVQ